MDLQSSNANCGACGATCPTGTTCFGGKCVGTCIPTTCAAQGKNCGVISDGCGNLINCGSCAPGQACQANICVTVCAPGQMLCSGQCVDLATNIANCGACGVICPTGAVCTGGMCICPAGTSLVNGKCQSPTCNDMLQNGLETDIDCGGPNCPKCFSGRKCLVNSDCTSGICNAGICA